MKTYKLKVPLKSISTEQREDNYYWWQWLIVLDLASLFAEEIKKDFNFSYNDYYENDGYDEDYSFWFLKDSIEYFVYLSRLQDTDEFVEFEMQFDTFAVKKFLCFTRRSKSKKFYKKFEETILKIIKENGFITSEMENS